MIRLIAIKTVKRYTNNLYHTSRLIRLFIKCTEFVQKNNDLFFIKLIIIIRIMGIEPIFSAWKAGHLPLMHIRVALVNLVAAFKLKFQRALVFL